MKKIIILSLILMFSLCSFANSLTNNRLRTGSKVNSALDNPTSYFTASSNASGVEANKSVKFKISKAMDQISLFFYELFN